MKLNNFFRAAFIAVSVLLAASCKVGPTENQTAEQNPEEVTFYVKVKGETITDKVNSDFVTHESAELTFFHNGTNEDGWYGFVTKDFTTDEAVLIRTAVLDLLKSGKFATELKFGNKANIKVNELEQLTNYKYIVFGLNAEGEVYGKHSACTFTTDYGPFYKIDNGWDARFKKYELVTYADITYDCIILDIEKKAGCKSKYFYPFMLSESNYKYNTVDLGRTEDQIAMLIGQDYEYMFQYYMSYSKDYTMDSLTMKASGEYPEPRYSNNGVFYSGKYYVFVMGFNEKGVADKTYQMIEVEVPEAEAYDHFNKWLGQWNVSDGKISYDIEIDKYDNNLSFLVYGWETGENAEYDMDQMANEGYRLMFEAYYDAAAQQMALHPITYGYLTQAGDTLFGLYGFFQLELNDGTTATEFSFGYEFDSNKIGVGTLEEDGQKGKFTGADVNMIVYDGNGAYVGTLPIEYLWFQYAAINLNDWSYSPYNEVPKFPMSVTRTGDLSENPDKAKPKQATQPVDLAKYYAAPAFVGPQGLTLHQPMVIRERKMLED